MGTNEHELDKTTEHAESTKIGLERLAGLFAQTQTVMQAQAARAVDNEF